MSITLAHYSWILLIADASNLSKDIYWFADTQLSNWGGSGAPLRFSRGNAVPLARPWRMDLRDTTRDSETEPHWALWNTEKPTSSTGLSSVQKQSSLQLQGLCPPDPLTRPPLGALPQTLIIGSCSPTRHSITLPPIYSLTTADTAYMFELVCWNSKTISQLMMNFLLNPLATVYVVYNIVSVVYIWLLY